MPDTAQGRIMPDAMPTLGDIPRHVASLRPGAIALSFEGRDTDWATLDTRADKVANALAALGCRPGDHIATVGKNSDELFELLFGAARAGIVMTPVIWRLATPEIIDIVADSEAEVLFLGSDQLARLAAIRAAVPRLRVVIAMSDGTAAGLPRFDAWRDQGASDPPRHGVEPAAAAIQLYTSGTTGKPKGVMLSHDNLLAPRRAALRVPMPWNEWRDDDVNLVAMPGGHIAGIGWGIVSLFNGATTIVQREFDPAKVLDAIEHRGVSKIFLVPTALQMVLMQPRARQVDYSRLRHILYGASPIALDLLRECAAVFGCGFCQQYGMTETCGTIVYLPPEDHDAAGTPRMRGAGIPMPGVEIRVVGPDRAPLAPNETGEVETRSVANMLGYWRNPRATAETVGHDGWLRTGDAGYLDADGYLYIQDRYKDMIVSGGENIYPAEVENAVYGHPAVLEVAVIGVPDERWGEAVKAIVVLRPGTAGDADDIIAFARARIGGYKVPKSVDFIAALPRNPSGKVLRRALREPYWGNRERQVN